MLAYSVERVADKKTMMSNSLMVTCYKLQVYKKYRSYSLKRIAYNIIYSEKRKA